MKKLYYHIEVQTDPNTGESFCVRCGSKVKGNVSENPCAVPTPAQSVYGNYRFEISVDGDYMVDLICFTEDEKGQKTYYSLICDEDVYEEIDSLMRYSVYKAHNIVHVSKTYPFIYPLNEELEEFLEKAIEAKAIIIEKN